jgi:hypothetical protein
MSQHALEQHVYLDVTFTVTQQLALDTSKSVQHYRTAISSTCTGIFRPPWLCHRPPRQGNAIRGVHVTYRCQHRAAAIRTLAVLDMQRNLPAPNLALAKHKLTPCQAPMRNPALTILRRGNALISRLNHHVAAYASCCAKAVARQLPRQ